ncbi:class I SAM-dependent methyltransferase [Roseibacterium beibuensis]|uniref:Methyltransferase domain-containing protein n=1 Tax=[Roseibacterium] beibuensis TaxID=1193142 RepID=A0ABP9LU72_9RHOB|nr:class I SAM-dependent methyltransferase [Roseibacterium beibuensis]MCS6623008.1 class I SAM-dependent methyltransferase [Roseibacterium beibuensis]
MRLDPDARFQLDKPLDRDVDLYIGAVCLGKFAAGERNVPLSRLAMHFNHLADHKLTAKTDGGETVFHIDTRDFEKAYRTGDLLTAMQTALGGGKWRIYEIGIKDGSIYADVGFVFPLSIRTPVTVDLLCNGMSGVLLESEYDTHFGRTHWFMPPENVVRHKYRFPFSQVEGWAQFHLRALNGKSSDAAHYRDQWNFTNRDMLAELPDDTRIQRVASAQANRASFLNGGKAAYEVIQALFHRYGSAASKPEIKVLDWGVGCGRVARHFETDSAVQMTGIDIDKDNVGWCSENLTGEYLHVETAPPTPMPNGIFDLVYACSVLSHLKEESIDQWLAEVSRLLRPDGLALLSFHGTSNAVSYLSRRPEELRALMGGELFDADRNNELQGFISDEDYYRQVFSSDSWWHQKFSEFFEVLAIEPAVLSGFQHVAVLRLKP